MTDDGSRIRQLETAFLALLTRVQALERREELRLHREVFGPGLTPISPASNVPEAPQLRSRPGASRTR